STAGSVTVAITVLLLLPGILQFITLDWVQDAIEYLPVPAATAFVTVSDAFGGAGSLGPWQGAVVVAGWAIVPMVAGAIVLRRRDACPAALPFSRRPPASREDRAPPIRAHRPPLIQAHRATRGRTRPRLVAVSQPDPTPAAHSPTQSLGVTPARRQRADSFYEAVGGHATFAFIVHRFYEQVATDDILRPMYPEDDLDGAENRLRMFLEQYWGGPTT